MTKPQAKQQTTPKVATICGTIIVSVGGSLVFINQQWERQFDFLKTNQINLETRLDKRFDKIDSNVEKLDEKIDKVLVELNSHP